MSNRTIAVSAKLGFDPSFITKSDTHFDGSRTLGGILSWRWGALRSFR